MIEPVAAATFSPAWLLGSPHAQTIWGRLTRSGRMIPMRREIVRTPDDDELIVDHLDGRELRFVLLHGLEGSSNSVYIQGILAAIARRGFAATALNFRSCARDPRNLSQMIMNRQPRLYHSGETSDFDFLIDSLPANPPIAAIGASLGGNVILKWLGEHPEQSRIRAAATMSVPYDLAAGARYLEQGFGPFYVANFLRTMKKKAASVVARFGPRGVDLPRAMRARTFHQFDDAATAPLNGFTSAEDYYTRASSIGFLGRITAPTLCINAEDDPFVPTEVVTRAQAAASKALTFEVTPCGGHTGFIAGLPWQCHYWAEERLVDWLVKSVG